MSSGIVDAELVVDTIKKLGNRQRVVLMTDDKLKRMIEFANIDGTLCIEYRKNGVYGDVMLESIHTSVARVFCIKSTVIISCELMHIKIPQAQIRGISHIMQVDTPVKRCES